MDDLVSSRRRPPARPARGRWWSMVALAALVLAGGALALLGLALAFNLVSLRWLADNRHLPLAGWIAQARGGLDHGQAQLLEGALGGAGLLLLAAVAATVAIIALGRRPASPAGMAARIVVALGSGVLSLLLLTLSLHWLGLWPEMPWQATLDSALRRAVAWLWGHLRRAI